jgi:hypothetical protein
MQPGEGANWKTSVHKEDFSMKTVQDVCIEVHMPGKCQVISTWQARESWSLSRELTFDQLLGGLPMVLPLRCLISCGPSAKLTILHQTAQRSFPFHWGPWIMPTEFSPVNPLLLLCSKPLTLSQRKAATNAKRESICWQSKNASTQPERFFPSCEWHWRAV